MPCFQGKKPYLQMALIQFDSLLAFQFNLGELCHACEKTWAEKTCTEKKGNSLQGQVGKTALEKYE